MPELEGQIGELRFTLEITRAETGETETIEMVGRIGDAAPTEKKDEE